VFLSALEASLSVPIEDNTEKGRMHMREENTVQNSTVQYSAFGTAECSRGDTTKTFF
jgi:hypothetical protein